jgi:hypothetical protein
MVVDSMILPGHAHVVTSGEGRTVDLGVAQMRVLASSDATTGGAFALTEFAGTGEGAWTVPHLHRGFEESFFILDGLFTLMVPGGLEEMFFELGRLPPNVIRDPATRAAISARYDSIPV